MPIRTIARRAVVLISILAAAVGGVIIDSHRIFGFLLVAVGIVGAMYMYLSSEVSQGENEEFFEIAAQMLSVAGLGNPYTKQIKIWLSKGGTYKDILSDLDKALEIDPSDMDALALYVPISALDLSLERHLAGERWKRDEKRLRALLARADVGILSGRNLSQFYAGKGVLLDIAGEHSQAQALFRESGRGSSVPYWRLALSTSFGMEKNYAASLSEMESAISEGAKGPAVDFHYARALSCMGQYEKAIELFERVRTERGNYFFLLEELKIAHWLSWHPLRSAYFDLLCGFYVARRNPTSAFKFFASGLWKALLPHTIVGANFIQAIARRLPRLRHTKVARLNEPGNPQAAMGMSLVEQGKFSSASVQFSIASRKTTNIGVWINLCSSAIIAGNWVEAERAYQYLDQHYPEEIPQGYREAIFGKITGLDFDVNKERAL